MDPEELAQALRDERALRLAAEQRVAQLTEHVATWRGRAEERADRIEALRGRAEVPWLRRAARSLSAGLERPAGLGAPSSDTAPGTAGVPPAAGASATGGPGPSHPQVACVALVGGSDLRPALAELRTTAVADPQALAAADLVVVDDAGLRALDDAARSVVEEWAATPGRVPLVRVMDDAQAGPLLAADEVRVAARDTAGATTIASFDARRHHPGAAAPDLGALHGAAADDGIALRRTGSGNGATGGLVPPDALTRLWSDPPRWFLELAARGLGGWSASLDDDRGAAAVRRVAVRRHASWVAADRLLELAGVAAPRRDDRVAAVLVSNRADRVVAAVEGIARSRGVDLELVVGLHGFAPPPALTAALARLDLPVRVHEFDTDSSLGRCLNACIASTGAPFVAKVDDDDHYGPHHLEDGVQALRYAGADLVGKGTQFTYLGPRDTTVLRRPRSEEVLLDGTPTGASWVLRRALWERVGGFPHRPRRVDALFLEGARAAGARVYANSRWEFCYVRSAQGHTWTTAEETFLAGAEPAWDGHHPDRTEVDDSMVGA